MPNPPKPSSCLWKPHTSPPTPGRLFADVVNDFDTQTQTSVVSPSVSACWSARRGPGVRGNAVPVSPVERPPHQTDSRAHGRPATPSRGSPYGSHASASVVAASMIPADDAKQPHRRKLAEDAAGQVCMTHSLLYTILLSGASSSSLSIYVRENASCILFSRGDHSSMQWKSPSVMQTHVHGR